MEISLGVVCKLVMVTSPELTVYHLPAQMLWFLLPPQPALHCVTLLLQDLSLFILNAQRTGEMVQ